MIWNSQQPVGTAVVTITNEDGSTIQIDMVVTDLQISKKMDQLGSSQLISQVQPDIIELKGLVNRQTHSIVGKQIKDRKKSKVGDGVAILEDVNI